MSEANEAKNAPMIVTFLSARKSPAAAQVARGFGVAGKKVLIIDLDCEGRLSEPFENEGPHLSVAAIFPKDGKPAAKSLDDVITATGCENVWLAPTDRILMDLHPDDASTLRREIQGLERPFDVIVIDCPFGPFGSMARNAIAAIAAGNADSTVMILRLTEVKDDLLAPYSVSGFDPKRMRRVIRIAKDTLSEIGGVKATRPLKVIPG